MLFTLFFKLMWYLVKLSFVKGQIIPNVQFTCFFFSRRSFFSFSLILSSSLFFRRMLGLLSGVFFPRILAMASAHPALGFSSASPFCSSSLFPSWSPLSSTSLPPLDPSWSLLGPLSPSLLKLSSETPHSSSEHPDHRGKKEKKINATSISYKVIASPYMFKQCLLNFKMYQMLDTSSDMLITNDWIFRKSWSKGLNAWNVLYNSNSLYELHVNSIPWS